MDTCFDCGNPENNHQFFHIFKSSREESDLTIKPQPNSYLDQFFESPFPSQSRTVKFPLFENDPRCLRCCTSKKHPQLYLTVVP